MELQGVSFQALSQEETKSVNGGAIQVVGAIAAGALAYVAYEVIDEGVQRSTGTSIAGHISNGVGYVVSGIGSGLQSIGSWISGN